jgi:hypothetical protein
MLAGPLAASLALVVLAASSCNGGDGSVNHHGQAVTGAPAQAAGLTPLYKRLRNRGFSVEVVSRADLSAIRLIASRGERRRRNLPRSVRPSTALQTDLPGNLSAFVYRFKSAKLAEAVAPSFLDYFGDGVQGCGRTVYFTRHERHGLRDYTAWSAEVVAFLRRSGGCNGHNFGVVS